ncbi:hypothetical protein HAZT_HAZT000700 [Hyalella azteca]|nr:hypothetical protein HAZT_HAZT000700 [Hyalella azteca]
MDITRSVFQSADPKEELLQQDVPVTPSSTMSSFSAPSSTQLSFFTPLPPIRRSSFSAPSSAPSTSSSTSSTSPMWSGPLSPGVHMACCLMYRGQVKPSDVTTAIKKVIQKRAINFVSWTPTGFKVGVNYQPVTTLPELGLPRLPRSVCVLSNTTSARHQWEKLAADFDKLFSKKAFCFWYLDEGMSLEDLTEAREDVAVMIKEYMDVEEMTSREAARRKIETESLVDSKTESLVNSKTESLVDGNAGDARVDDKKRRRMKRPRLRNHSLP